MRNKDKKQEDEAYENLTVANMDVDGMPWYKTKEQREKADALRETHLTRGERRAMIKGAYAALMPAFFVGLLVFCAAFALLMLYFRCIIG